MTDEEKADAEMYANKKHCSKCINFGDCVETAIEDRCKTYRESYADYLAGLTEGRKEYSEIPCTSCCITESLESDLSDLSANVKELEKENAELKAKIEELKKDKEWLDNTNNEQTKVILKLNEQIKLIESVAAANADLIQKMKCCRNEMLSKLSL